MIRSATADDLAIQVLSNEGAQCGTCGAEPGDRTCSYCEKARARYIAALRAAGWAPRAELQKQLDRVTRELGAIKQQMAALTRRIVPR
jgi:hypothetical protein